MKNRRLLVVEVRKTMLNQRLNPHAETILRAERDWIVQWLVCRVRLRARFWIAQRLIAPEIYSARDLFFHPHSRSVIVLARASALSVFTTLCPMQ
jgi:hypothetical protein